ncbi:MAG: molybdenum cofactor synthesis domain-containing protein [Candidatus Aramenus sulfurataquae]|jgi:molybdenum cofactor biosynthesis protein B|uniref:Molybdenum cofactor biosynthesis protein MoaB n=2 Tax=Candidatus Aramenus sulfurataquae TaxID=1326980 RepID=W7L5T2_9CREN|nr:MAG: molybdenum cofactor synthesis domain-containing protein [Candidatus Aramenus sulfurataquae]MCL7343545.1 molybdenum cofactor biosynthesis protein MoaB [Candidatus Aramenus sulfurataquae]
MEAHETHRHNAPKVLNFYVITISTSRYEKMQRKEPVVDESGDVIKQLVISSNHSLVGYELVPDNKVKILKAILNAVDNDKVDVVVTTGGTGYSPSDTTVEAVRKVLDREVEGFGDVFRLLSYNDPKVRSASYLSKASAGVLNGKVIYMLPGSPRAVELAMRELILPEAPHLVYIVRSK